MKKESAREMTIYIRPLMDTTSSVILIFISTKPWQQGSDLPDQSLNLNAHAARNITRKNPCLEDLLPRTLPANGNGTAGRSLG